MDIIVDGTVGKHFVIMIKKKGMESSEVKIYARRTLSAVA